jgi:hypothetical protein
MGHSAFGMLALLGCYYYVIKKNSIDSPLINNIVREVKQKKIELLFYCKK